MDQYAGSPGHCTYCYAELSASFINFIIARHLLDFMVHGKITEADALTIHLDATPSGLSVPPSPSSRHFHAECPFCRANLPIYPGLGQALSNAGWHAQ